MWRFFAKLFGAKKQNAPAVPFEQRLSMARDDRDFIRIAGEAMRAHLPQIAHVAYWRAAMIYIEQQHHLKVLATLNTILTLAPNDADALVSRIHALGLLDRRRDAALACVDLAHRYDAGGDRENAHALIERARTLDPSVFGDLAPPPPPVAVVMGQPVGDTIAVTGIVELDLDPVRANISVDTLGEANTSYSFEALPSALMGTEHEAVARGYLDSTPDQSTRAYDQSELSTLLDEDSAAS
jgi:hypothetical protein